MEDLTSTNWNKGMNSSGTTGCYFKTKVNGYYYKLPSFNNAVGFFGHETASEVIVSRLGNILGINTLEQTLKKVKVRIGGVEYVTYACKSADYKPANSNAMPFERFYGVYREKGEDLISFIGRAHLEEWFDTMFVLDYIIINRDRHGANIEVINSRGRANMAPYFDNGLSFVCSITKDMSDYKKRLRNFDIFKDIAVNNYVGSRSLHSNLSLVSGCVRLHRLLKEHKKNIFYGMSEYLGKEHIDKIWQIIVYRYSFLRKRGLIIVD